MQADDGGLLAVLPLLTPISCDLDTLALTGDLHSDEDDSKASEDRRCANALVRLSKSASAPVATVLDPCKTLHTGKTAPDSMAAC